LKWKASGEDRRPLSGSAAPVHARRPAWVAWESAESACPCLHRTPMISAENRSSGSDGPTDPAFSRNENCRRPDAELWNIGPMTRTGRQSAARLVLLKLDELWGGPILSAPNFTTHTPLGKMTSAPGVEERPFVRGSRHQIGGICSRTARIASRCSAPA